jgi:hypothetical protein
MAAGEDELQALVGDRLVVERVVEHGVRHLQQPGLRGEHPLAADAVDRAVARGRHEPAARVRRDPVARPSLGGDGEGLLGGLLGAIEVAEEADQRGEHASPLRAEDLLDQRSTRGRTSIAPPMRAAGMRAASSIAVSRFSACSR